ncbi:hypothetical protein D3C74_185410 [compost metagenome]
MLTVTRTTNFEKLTIVKPEDTINFLVPLFTKLLKGGKLHALLNSTLAEARQILADDEYDSPEEARYVLNKTIGQTKQAITIAAKRSIQCCGFPLVVRGGYNKRTDHHLISILCPHCGCFLEVEEQGGRRYYPVALNRKEGFRYARTSSRTDTTSNYDC